MEELTEEQQQRIDAYLFEDCILAAMRVYREITHVGIVDAQFIVGDRQSELKIQYPERFKSDHAYRQEAYDRLKEVTSRILVMEGSWDADSEGPFVRLSAISEGASSQHPRYTERCLYFVRGSERQVERAIEFGTELAQSVGVNFYLTSTDQIHWDDEKRWWDEQEEDK